jgi:endonuclease YncB( thermonuclease family)
LSEAEVIELRNLRRGRHFFLVADVVVDGRSLARKLVRARLAKRYYGGPKPGWP